MKTGAATAESGFSLAELVVSMSASVIIIGTLLVSSTSLHKAMHGSELYALSYADQRRLIDFVARDLRRGITVAGTDAAGEPRALAGSSLEIADRASLTVTLPAYYRSHLPAESSFDQPLAVVATGDRLDYGIGATPAPPVEVSFRKIFLAEEKAVCFVRQEADVREVIVRDAENLHLRITVTPDGQSGGIEVWFRSAYSTLRTLVASHDEIMLRNPRPK